MRCFLLQKIYGGMTDIFKKAFYLLKLLARENVRVQHHIMERLDILLDVRVVESDLAIALKEVNLYNYRLRSQLEILKQRFISLWTRHSVYNKIELPITVYMHFQQHFQQHLERLFDTDMSAHITTTCANSCYTFDSKTAQHETSFNGFTKILICLSKSYKVESQLLISSIILFTQVKEKINKELR